MAHRTLPMQPMQNPPSMRLNGQQNVDTGQFKTDGYAVLPVFDPERVRAAERDISDHIDRLSHALHLPFETSHPDAPLGERLDRISAHDRSQANLLRIALCTDAHRGPRLHAWHSDVSADDGTDCGGVRISAWLPLSDAGPETGGLELIPGRRTAPMAHRGEQAHVIDAAQLDRLPRVRPACPAGHVLFLDRFTPHRSLPPGPQARFALVIWMKVSAGAHNASTSRNDRVKGEDSDEPNLIVA